MISHAIANAIAELNIVTHSRVAVLQEPTAYWICSMLGIWRAGATYVPLEISQGTQRLATIVQDAQLAAILAQDDTLPLVAGVGWNKPDFVINLSRLSISSSTRVPELDKPVDKDEAMVLYTSGSTNVPKVCYFESIKLRSQGNLQHEHRCGTAKTCVSFPSAHFLLRTDSTDPGT